MGKKRERVPNVLWTLYKDKARTLSTTITSLIPTNCNCNARGKCLRCVFGINADAYLLRPHDPLDYRRFMKNCFVVVPEPAPPLPSLLSFTCFWSQLQIVDRTIQTYFTKQKAPSNVMCNGYQRFKQNSSIVKLLTQSIWDLVLKRVGDSVMMYLLMHTSIFMPIKYNVHQQVTGSPVKRVFGRSPAHPPSSSVDARHPRKRKRENRKDSVSEEPPSKVPAKTGHFEQNSWLSVGIEKEDNDDSPCSVPSVLPQLTKTSNCFDVNGSHNLDIHEQKSIEVPVKKTGKRFRLPSWQRRKRHKRLVLEESSTQGSSSKVSGAEDDLNKSREHNLVRKHWLGKVEPALDKNCCKRRADMQLFCPCCSVFQSLSQLPMVTRYVTQQIRIRNTDTKIRTK